MENDLIKKYFREDLTEAEEQALSERILASTEDAVRFGEEAHARYARYGLPEPELSKSFAGSAPVSASVYFTYVGLKVLAGLLGLALAGVVAFGLWHAFAPISIDSGSSAPDLGASMSQAPLVTPGQIHRAHSSASASMKALWVVPVLTPIDLDHPSGKPFSNLSITVHKVAAGAVTVQVTTLEGESLVPLYRGTLKPGNWGFEWNGQLSDGRAAASGYYQIQLDSGSATQKKVIQIQ